MARPDPEAAVAAGLDRGVADRGTLVFVTGFVISPYAYTALLAPLAAAGHRVVVPRLYRRGPRVLVGACSPGAEAVAAADVVDLVRGDTPVVLGGHSRGGFVAWLAAAQTGVDGLVVVDPVTGGGPPWARPGPPPPAPVAPTLIIGAALGGRCAPAGRNHEQLAAAAPDATHVVVDDCGHVDMLDGTDARLGRRVCGSGRDPDAARTRITTLLRDFLDARA